MILGFISDIHIPMFAHDAYHMLTLQLPSIDVLLIAGDLTKKGVWRPFVKWYKQMKHVWKPKMVIAVWGNADKTPVRENLPKALPDLIILEDQTLSLNGITIIGTEGVIDKPTLWQRRNIPNIEEIYQRRIEWIVHTVKIYSRTILLSHYGVCDQTIEEAPDIGGLTSMKLCKQLKAHPPTLTIHGHSHHATTYKIQHPFYIYNVALPIHRKPLLIDSCTLEEIKVGMFS